jgi:BolA protein
VTAREEMIRDCLTAAFSPEALEIEDESHLHAGHAGARDGRGHFRVLIVSSAFSGLNRVQRHRLIYDALGSMMQSDIHALSLQIYGPDEI